MAALLIPILAGTVSAATPLIFAATGELVAERSGVLNLGVEGMMLIGAVTAFAVALAGYPAPVAALAAAGAVIAAALAFAFLALCVAEIDPGHPYPGIVGPSRHRARTVRA